MTREQASEVIAMTLDKIATQIMGAEMMDNETRQGLEHTIRAFTMARTALRGPQPDPITGLVPCGCGGKAKIWPSNLRQATHVIIDYEVGCTECAMTTGWVRGKQEHAVKVWNTAMGWRAEG